MRARLDVPVLCFFLIALPSLRGQSGPQVRAQNKTNSEDIPPATLRATRREVLVDMVVRDKHHKLIMNLLPEEVQVFEDGVLQKINDFRDVQGVEQIQTEEAERSALEQSNADGTPATHRQLPASRPTSLHQLNFVAVVLANIAPLNLEFAREAVQDFLNSGSLPNTYVSIYRLNGTLRIVQFYTANKQLLLKATDAASKGLYTDDGLGVNATVTAAAYSTLQAAADNVLSSPRLDQATADAVRNTLLHPEPMISLDPLFARNAASQDASFELGNAIVVQARIENGIRFASSLANGMNTLDALREIVRSQEPLPGRKVVLYLSDGLDFPMNRRDAIDSLISYANRSGVSFYAVDTRGLSVQDPMMQSLAELERTSAISSAQKVDPRTGHKEEDSVELTAVSNKQLALRELAESTGGFVVTDTNQIAAPMKRVMEDIRFHYQIAYTPSNTNYDGRFRKIEIRIARRHMQVQSRKGYFALPDLNGRPLLPFEAQGLAAISGQSVSTAFPYHIAVMKFRPRQEAVEHEVAFEVPVSDFRVSANPKSGKSRIKVALLAVVRNAKGDIVRKISRELVREVPAHSAVATNDRILYAEPIQLPPGHYELDSAVTDEEAGKTSVKRLAFYVNAGNNFGLSSLERVRQSRSSSDSALEGGTTAVDPAHLLPELSDSVAPGKPVNLYFVVYPSYAQADAKPKVILQVLRNGKEVAREDLHLPPPQPDGSVPMIVKISPQPGQCDVLVTAEQGTLVAQSALSVRVE